MHVMDMHQKPLQTANLKKKDSTIMSMHPLTSSSPNSVPLEQANSTGAAVVNPSAPTAPIPVVAPSTTTTTTTPQPQPQPQPIVPETPIQSEPLKSKSKANGSRIFDPTSFLPFLRQSLTFAINSRIHGSSENQTVLSKYGKVIFTFSHPVSQKQWIPLFAHPPLFNQFQVNLIICRTQYAFQVSFSQHENVPPNIIPLGETASLISSIQISEFLAQLPILFAWSITPDCLYKLFYQLKLALRSVFTKLLSASNNQKIQFELSTISELPQLEYIIKKNAVIFELQLADVKILEPEQSLAYKMALLKMQTVADPSTVVVPPEPKILSPPNLAISFPLFYDASGKSTAPGKIPENANQARFPEPMIVFTNSISSSMFTNPLTGKSLLNLPPWTDHSCILDHFYIVTEAMNAQGTLLVDNLWKKALFCLALQKMFFQTLEFDTALYNSISLLHEESTFSTIFQVSLPPDWPNTLPKVTLISPHYVSPNGKPISRIVKDYPYSPRWSPDEMAKRLFEGVKALLAPFNQLCLDISQKQRKPNNQGGQPHSGHGHPPPGYPTDHGFGPGS